MGTFSKDILTVVSSAKKVVDKVAPLLHRFGLIVVDASVLLHLVYNRHHDVAYRIAARQGNCPFLVLYVHF